MWDAMILVASCWRALPVIVGSKATPAVLAPVVLVAAGSKPPEVAVAVAVTGMLHIVVAAF
jgi:hypothetical protein